MANNAVWQVLHLLCILAHVGMIFTGMAAFAVNGHDAFDEIKPGNMMYSWAITFIGTVGTAFNHAIFGVLWEVTRSSYQGADNKQYFKQKVTIVTSLIIQLVMTITDIAMGRVIAGKTFGKASLVIVCVVAFIAGAMSLATAIADISQLNYHRRLNRGGEINLVEIIDDV